MKENAGKKHTRKRRVAAVLLAAMTVCSLAGCGPDEVIKGQAGLSGNTVSVGSPDDGTEAMGRFVEEAVELPEGPGHGARMTRTADGTYVIQNEEGVRFQSQDGTAWETESVMGIGPFMQKYYIIAFEVTADGGMAVSVCDRDEADEKEWEEQVKECMYIAPDGTQHGIEVPFTSESMYVRAIYASETGRIFATAIGDSGIYELHPEEGTADRYLAPDCTAELIRFAGNTMLICSPDGILLYDMEKEEWIEDQVLNNFMTEQYDGQQFYSGGWYDTYVFSGEENVIYIAGKKGLYRHAIGGSAVEQVIDGTLSSFGDPSVGIGGMLMLEDGSFLTLFGNGKLVRYVYRSDIPTVPSQKLKIYSLKEKDTLLQAITMFQSANPDAYVEYETGLLEDSSVTKEDAIKNLNTKIMAGEGPDIVILDGLPADSYMEKGVLTDLSPFLAQMTGDAELFENVTEAFRTEGGIYAVPAEFSIPVAAGSKEVIDEITSLRTYADQVERLREKNPGKDIINLFSERMILRICALSSAPSWKAADGAVNEEALREYLSQAKRVYDAQFDGLPQDLIDQFEEQDIKYSSNFGYHYDEDDHSVKIMSKIMDYAAGNVPLIAGILSDMYSYSQIYSLQKAAGCEDTEFRLFDGLSQGVFMPNVMAGINAASSQKELAEAFLRMLMGKEVQSLIYTSLPVNKAAFVEQLADNPALGREAGQLSGAIAVSGEDGVRMDMDTYWPDEDAKKKLQDMAASVTVPNITDGILEEAVYEEGERFLAGHSSLEETISAVLEKTSLYMAE